MRSWNFITFDQVSGRVTSSVAVSGFRQKKRSRSGMRGWVPAVIVGTLIAASTPTMQLQPPVSGTDSKVKLSVEAVSSTAPLKPPFSDKFKRFFDHSFVLENSEKLRTIASIGSSLDNDPQVSGVVMALADAEDSFEWKPGA